MTSRVRSEMPSPSRANERAKSLWYPPSIHVEPMAAPLPVGFNPRVPGVEPIHARV